MYDGVMKVNLHPDSAVYSHLLTTATSALLFCRLRKLVRELEPEVTEVPRLFRLVLCDCLDEHHEDLPFRVRSLRARAIFWSQQRSKSVFSIGLSSHQCLKSREAQDRETLCKKDDTWVKDEEHGMAVPLRRRVRSMPDISSIEESAQRGIKGATTMT